MNQTNFTCKLPILGGESLCILNSEWTETDIILLLLYDNQGWSGMFQGNDLEELINQLSLTKEKYMEESRYALTTYGGAPNFSYSIENDTFTWKKLVKTNMIVKFGYVNLSRIPAFQVFETMLDKNLQWNMDLTTRFHVTEEQRKSYETENQSLERKLNELIEQKNEMETTLYNQFLCLLNEKKKRIAELRKMEQRSEITSEKDSSQSESDSFGSDRDMNSGEEEKLSKKDRQMSAKRTRPSGCSRNPHNNDAYQESKNVYKGAPKCRKKSPREDCVLKKVGENQQQSNSEENIFMFPKRSKGTKHKPTPSKLTLSVITYDSDDESILPQPLQSDEMQDQKSVIRNEDNTVKIGKVEENKNNSSNIVKETENMLYEKTDVVPNTSIRGFSTSTFNMLNKLI